MYKELAFLAYYLHWDYKTIIDLEHRERRRWCQEISKIHKELNVAQDQIPLDINLYK